MFIAEVLVITVPCFSIEEIDLPEDKHCNR